jgi:hypothetical protein
MFPQKGADHLAALWRKAFQAPWIVALFVAAFAALRVIYTLHFRIDSDEPQHLHVVWAWANGMLPYRDVFDNHTPVFQALCAPIFRLFGERGDIVLWMRLAIVPFFVLTLWCVKSIVASFADRRTAILSTWLAALFPPFFYSSIEFRPDQMWTAVWMATIAILVNGRATPKRAFAAGLMLGLSFAVSMKTSLMLAALGAALIGTMLIVRDGERTRDRMRALALCALSGVGGMMIIPALVVLFFVSRGAGREMYYCVIQHNIIPGNTDSSGLLLSFLRLACMLPLVAIVGIILKRRRMPVPIKRRISFSFLAAAFYYVFLVSFWPVLTAEDYLPFFPAMMVSVAPFLLWLSGLNMARLGVTATQTAVFLMLLELSWIIGSNSPFNDQAADKVGMVADTLSLTSKRDYVMDSKGETIYRQRPFFYVLERMTQWRLHNGLLEDNTIQRMIDTRAPLALTRRMPADTRRFIQNNYVRIAYRLRVLGQELPMSSSRKPTPVTFDLAIPARYILVNQDGPVQGTVDGERLTGARELAVGQHEFIRASGTHGTVILVWANAWERGYSPFREIKPDVSSQQD